MEPEWNYFFDELMYYLARKYRADEDNDVKYRLVDLSGVYTLGFSFKKSPLDLWYNIIKAANTQKKLKQLLNTILKDPTGAGDEYLIAAVAATETNKILAEKDLADDAWKGQNDLKLSKEKIIGKRSNLLPIHFLSTGVRAAGAVVRIETDTQTGTGFLIEGGWLLTNNHVIPDLATLETAIAQFNFQYPATYVPGQNAAVKLRAEKQIAFAADPNGLPRFFTDIEDDWTLINLRESDLETASGYGTLKFAEKPIVTGDFVNIIQHPLGGPKQIGIYNNMVMHADDKIVQYLTDTNDGSSGSPVFNSNWEVVALHNSGGWLPDPVSNNSVKRNQGTNITVIKRFMEKLAAANDTI